jgi:hypothetical protein
MSLLRVESDPILRPIAWHDACRPDDNNQAATKANGENGKMVNKWQNARF